MPDILLSPIIYLGSFVLVLSVVVFVHEFGHFQVAKWRGVAIDTFSIGFGKKLIGWRDRRGVEWKIGALPLGGYVKFADDADALSTAPAQAYQDPEAKADARRRGLFHAQSLVTRSLVVAAGPLTNFVFSIFAFGLIVFIIGRDLTDYTNVRPFINGVVEGSAAQAAGVRAGELVDAVDGVQVRGLSNFRERIAASPGRPIELRLLSENGGSRTLAVTPRASEDGTGAIGVSLTVRPQDRVIDKVNPIEAIGYGAVSTWAIITQTGDYVVGIFQGRNSGRDIAGPLGILNVSGQTASYAMDTPSVGPLGAAGNVALALLSLAAMLSVAVGIVNLLPIPILDGGHLLFYSIEALRGGKPLPPVAQEWAYRAGFAVMASLFLFATWNDISRLLPGHNG